MKLCHFMAARKEREKEYERQTDRQIRKCLKSGTSFQDTSPIRLHFLISTASQ
jgi:hypothetical protein